MGAKEKKLGLGVLASGRGTNLQAILDAAEKGRIRAQILAVVSDREEAPALARARRHSVPAACIRRESFPSRATFEEEIVANLRSHGVELVCLAGFMRILGPAMLEAFPGRILNIHPALLPSFPGLDSQLQALDYGVKIAGCTVHIVDDMIDHGPIILQAAVEVREGDTVEALSARILEEEHRLYPKAIGLIAEGRVAIQGRRAIIAPRES